MFWIIFVLYFSNALCFESKLELLPNIISVLNGSKINNNECYEQSQLFLDSLENMTLWAYEMWESSSRSSVGVLRGNAYQLGDFDECLKVSGPFKTQYCLVELHLELPPYLKQRYKYEEDYGNSTVFNRLNYNNDPNLIPRNILNVGLCLPASCSYKDLELSLNEELTKNKYKNDYNITYKVSVSENRCQDDRSEEDFTFGDIGFCFYVALLFTIVFFSTVYDTHNGNQYDISEYKKKDSTFDKILLCFSLKRNVSDLNKLNDNNQALRILYGLRTLCIVMIIIDHRIANFVSGPIMNKEFIENGFRSLATQIIVFNGDLFVDSFFVLSGLLVTYTLLSIYEKRTVSPFIIALARYIRLTPVYAVVVFFFATLFYKTGSGPLWKIMIEPEVFDCQKNWWVSILYLGNYLNVENMCIIYSWYLPCDFHFLIVSIPLIMLIKKNKAIGLSVLSTLMVISILIPAVITVIYQFPALTYFQVQAPNIPIFKKDLQFNTMYITSHCRFSTYAVGMFTGLIYFKLRKKPILIPRWKSHILTFLGLSLMVTSLCCGLPFYNPNYEYNPIEAAAYAALHRPAWAFGTSILLLNSSYGRFGLMRWVLSWKVWVPLSKLVYGAYLTHLCFQLRSVAVSLNPQFLDPVVVFQLAIQDLVLSFGAGLVLNLCVETPARRILKIIVEKKFKKDEDTSSDS